MRITGGNARNHRLAVPGTGTRPATDRTREAVFSMLGDRVSGASVLDLFAGSGAYGLEALSRGATHAWFLDSSREATDLLRNQNTRHPEFPKERWHVVETEVAHALRSMDFQQGPSWPFDLVFADPPYADAATTESLLEILPVADLLPHLAPDALLFLEIPSTSENLLAVIPELEILRSRCYGKSRIEVYRCTIDPCSPPVASSA